MKRSGAGVPLALATSMPYCNYLRRGSQHRAARGAARRQEQRPRPAGRGDRRDRAGRGRHQRGQHHWLRGLRELCQRARHPAHRRRHPDGLRPHRAVLQLRGRRASCPTSCACPSRSAATACRWRSPSCAPSSTCGSPGEHNGTFRGQQRRLRHRGRRAREFWRDDRAHATRRGARRARGAERAASTWPAPPGRARRRPRGAA